MEVYIFAYTPVGLNAAVRPLVPGELVGAGELPAAVLVAADEGLLACVPALVRLQVRRLGVHLAARREQAREHLVVVLDVRLRGRVLPAQAAKASREYKIMTSSLVILD